MNNFLLILVSQDFPMVPGHEIAGVVAAVGSKVTKFAVSDHVGVGCFVDSFGECEYCLSGEEQFCTKGRMDTYNKLDYEGIQHTVDIAKKPL
jgi:alcohol dehydrogenase (NADP+)